MDSTRPGLFFSRRWWWPFWSSSSFTSFGVACDIPVTLSSTTEVSMILRRIPVLALFFLTAAAMLAQRGRGAITNPIADNLTSSLVVHGSVVVPGEASLGRLVLVEETCGGRTQTGVYADSKGRFSFDLGTVDKSPTASKQNSAANVAECSIRATLTGYRSEPISLEQAVKKDKTELGDVALQPVGKADAARTSVTDASVPVNARKDYDKGLDAAAKMKWKEALGAMEKAASGYPQFATAWLNLGMLQAAQKDTNAALKSYARAIVADDKFALPYIESAVLEAGAGQWDKVV